MRIKTNLLIILLLLPIVLGFKTKNTNKSSAYFIESILSMAKDEMRKYHIPVSIKIAQAIFESGWGKSELAIYANNYFALKCRNNSDCTEHIFYLRDDDYDNFGNLKKSKFMSFNHPKESFTRHSIFLNHPRYANLFTLPITDYRGWAWGLQEAGYATNKNYAKKIIEIIERFELYKYDQEVINEGNNDSLTIEQLNKMSIIGQPSNPIKTPITNFEPTPISNIHHTNTTTEDEEFSYRPQATDKVQNPQEIDLLNQSFGNVDIENYIPEHLKDMFVNKGKIDSTEDSYPSYEKEIYDGGYQPR